jgi:hypothetical protein
MKYYHMHFRMAIIQNIKDNNNWLVSEAHSCNPSYSAGRDQKDPAVKIGMANSSQDLSWKTPS